MPVNHIIPTVFTAKFYSKCSLVNYRPWDETQHEKETIKFSALLARSLNSTNLLPFPFRFRLYAPAFFALPAPTPFPSPFPLSVLNAFKFPLPTPSPFLLPPDYWLQPDLPCWLKILLLEAILLVPACPFTPHDRNERGSWNRRMMVNWLSSSHFSVPPSKPSAWSAQHCTSPNTYSLRNPKPQLVTVYRISLQRIFFFSLTLYP